MSAPPPSYGETTTEAPPYSFDKPSSAQASQPTSVVFNLILDDTLIRSAAQPDTGVYQLTHPLDCGFSTIGISRLALRASRQGTTPRTYEKHLYDFRNPVFSSDVEIMGRRRGALQGTITFKPYQGLMRTGWEALQGTKDGKKLIFRTRPTRRPARKTELQWEDGRGSLVAVETQMHSTPDCRPRLHVVAPLDETMADVLVTAWCARIWSIYKIMEAAEKVEGLDSGMFTTCSCSDCHARPLLHRDTRV